MEYFVREMHEGITGAHEGTRTILWKITRVGYYCLTMYQYAEDILYRCEKCQKYAPIPRKSTTLMICISSQWSFLQWGIDIVGPFSQALGKVKFLLVVIDYFTKWVEEELLASITVQNIVKFFWKQIICDFGIPHIIILDNITQFVNNPFQEWCEDLRINQNFTSIVHLEVNGQTKVTKRTIVHGLETRLDQAKG